MWKRLFLIAFIVVVSSSAQAKPAFELDSNGKWVVLLSNLYHDDTCMVRDFRGVVIKRQFEDDRVSIAGLILELPDDSRDFINVDVGHAGLTLNGSGWIIRGLEALLTQGRVVDVSVKSCSFEYVLNLEAVREVPPED
ncbi:MAG: hypothetical protein JO289_00545 [Xanthobacteraceae bacterium]|nr:hypothetical protein [Xanthobacteraceae bacterium]